VTELAETHRYITPPIDQEVERIATEFLQSGGGFLSREHDRAGKFDGELSSLRPSWSTQKSGEAPEAAETGSAETVAAEMVAAETTEADVSATDGPASAPVGVAEAAPVSTGANPTLFRRLLSRFTGRREVEG
jgi:hypothetical protein